MAGKKNIYTLNGSSPKQKSDVSADWSNKEGNTIGGQSVKPSKVSKLFSAAKTKLYKFAEYCKANPGKVIAILILGLLFAGGVAACAIFGLWSMLIMIVVSATLSVFIGIGIRYLIQRAQQPAVQPEQ